MKAPRKDLELGEKLVFQAVAKWKYFIYEFKKLLKHFLNTIYLELNVNCN